jgi:hypothetical protein
MGCARRAKSVHKLQPVSMGIAVVVAFAPRHVDDLAPPDRRRDLPPPVGVGLRLRGLVFFGVVPVRSMQFKSPDSNFETMGEARCRIVASRRVPVQSRLADTSIVLIFRVGVCACEEVGFKKMTFTNIYWLTTTWTREEEGGGGGRRPGR